MKGNTMELEVGKSYETASGEVERISVRDTGGSYSFRSDTDTTYTPYGRFWSGNRPDSRDLVREHLSPQDRLKAAQADVVAAQAAVDAENDTVVVYVLQCRHTKQIEFFDADVESDGWENIGKTTIKLSELEQ